MGETLHKFVILTAGHREHRLPLDARPGLKHQLQELINHLKNIFRNSEDSVLPGWELFVLTGDATGVDSLCMEVCRDSGVSFGVVGVDSAEVNINSEAAEKIVFFPKFDSAEPGVLNQIVASRDEFAICYSDLLIAVWDYQSAKGVLGGTVRMIRDAIVIGRPVVLLGLDARLHLVDPRLIPSWDLKLLSCSEAEPEFIARYAQPISRDDLCNFIIKLLTPHNFVFPDSRSESIEDVKSWWVLSGRIDAIFNSIFSRGGISEIKKRLLKNPLNTYFGVSGEELSKQNHPVAEPRILMQEFAALDIKANVFSGLHRDINWIAYFLSALAVFVAVAGAISLGGVSSTKWAISEVFSIGGIIFLIFLSKKHKLHQRWLSNRYRAELIRYSFMCLPFLIPPDFMKSNLSLLDEGERLADSQDLDEHLEIRRMLVDSGVPSAINGGIYKPSEHFDALLEYAKHIVRDQMSFHKTTADRNHRTSHTLHKLSLMCFGLTAIAIIGHFFLHSPLWLIFTAALPALAAAIHGVATQNEFDRISHTSALTYAELKVVYKALNAPENWIGSSEAGKFLRLQKMTKEAAKIMSGATSSWQEIVISRATSLPA